MGKQDHQPLHCQTCGTQALPLYQSYSDGSYNCPTCAVDVDPYMTAEQRRAVQRHIDKARQARKNFQQSALIEPAAPTLFN